MSTHSPHDVEIALANLPQEIRSAVFDSSVGEKLQAIGKNHALQLDQIDALITDTRLVMIGVIKPDAFSAELQEDLNINSTVASAITTEVSEQIVKDVIQKMQEYKNGERVEYSDEEIEKMLSEDDTDLSSLKTSGIEVIDEKPPLTESIPNADRDVLLKQVEQPTAIIQSIPQPSKAADEIGRGITGEKLAGSFKIPSEERDYSINKSPDAVAHNDTIVRHRDRVDPYREPLE